MAVYDLAEEFSLIVSNLPPQIVENISGLITILKAVGIAFIVYVIYLVLMAILNFKRFKRIVRIENKVNLIEKKLNVLAKNKKKRK